MRIRNTTKNRILIVGGIRIMPERSAEISESAYEAYSKTTSGKFYLSKYLEVSDSPKKEVKKEPKKRGPKPKSDVQKTKEK